MEVSGVARRLTSQCASVEHKHAETAVGQPLRPRDLGPHERQTAKRSAEGRCRIPRFSDEQAIGPQPGTDSSHESTPTVEAVRARLQSAPGFVGVLRWQRKELGARDVGWIGEDQIEHLVIKPIEKIGQPRFDAIGKGESLDIRTRVCYRCFVDIGERDASVGKPKRRGDAKTARTATDVEHRLRRTAQPGPETAPNEFLYGRPRDHHPRLDGKPAICKPRFAGEVRRRHALVDPAFEEVAQRAARTLVQRMILEKPHHQQLRLAPRIRATVAEREGLPRQAVRARVDQGIDTFIHCADGRATPTPPELLPAHLEG